MPSRQIALEDIRVEIQHGTTNTMFAEWKWDVKNTDHFKVRWFYRTGDGVRFDGGEYTIESRLRTAVYTPPSNAKYVVFKIRPISKKHMVNGVETEYWTSIWSDHYQYAIVPDTTPEKTGAPNVSISGYNLTAELDLYDKNASGGSFQLVANNTTLIKTSSFVRKNFNHVSYTFNVSPGNVYKVRFRPAGYYFEEYGEWSEYSEPINTIPQTILSISGYALTETSIRLEWPESPIGATGYTIEYTTNLDYFDASNEVSSVSIEGNNTYVIITGLETGTKYFFRVKTSNDQGNSPWSEIIDVIVGTIPNPPTTWMSRSTIEVGESVILYWVHNSADGSKESQAELRIRIGSAPYETLTIFSDDSDTGISQYVYTPPNTVDKTILWEVRTMGVLPKFSEWSSQRSFTVLSPPIAYINMFKTLKWWWGTFNFQKDSIYTAMGDLDGLIDDDPVVKRFPILITGNTEPKTQKPISCHFSISPLTSYKSVNYTGEETWINAGDVIYEIEPNLSKNMVEKDLCYTTLIRIFPEDIILENGVDYKLIFSASLDSGLSVSDEYIFSVSLDVDIYNLDAEIGYDPESASMYIQPYCEDKTGNLVPNIYLSVYRQDFDGKFIEVVKGLNSSLRTVVTDPHPPLNYARYRIVGLSGATGTIMFNDLPSYPVQEKAIIIQWDETWKNFDAADDAELAEPVLSGSMIRLPYNITTSENNSKDVELVEYIGRESPVSYYGTQVGQGATYSVDIERDDSETLYALRRLSRYMGKVYVREPNGTGYWADITVSWNIENKSVIIPVSIKVTRVEGGL